MKHNALYITLVLNYWIAGDRIEELGILTRLKGLEL